MKVRKGQSQPEIVAAAFLFLYMVLGSPFLYQVLIVTHMSFTVVWSPERPIRLRDGYVMKRRAITNSFVLPRRHAGVADPFCEALSDGE